MMNAQMFGNCWQDVKGNLQRRWSHLKEEDLERARGSFEALVKTIQDTTGATREEVEGFLHDTVQRVTETSQEAVERARAYAHRAAEAMQETSDQAAEAVREGYEHAQAAVRRRPLESLALCFGLGVVTGVVVGIVLRSK
jgi:ElaB/YqjD/DUF883 family membrane-anchored ribosome-binding protein